MTITVNSTADAAADDGACTLREAITAANTNTASGAMANECPAGAAGLDIIEFEIAGVGVHTIQPTSPLPTIVEPAILDGYSQTGASVNTLAVGNNAVLLIEIDGSLTGVLNEGLITISAGGSTVAGLVVNRAEPAASAPASI